MNEGVPPEIAGLGERSRGNSRTRGKGTRERLGKEKGSNARGLRQRARAGGGPGGDANTQLGERGELADPGERNLKITALLRYYFRK